MKVLAAPWRKRPVADGGDPCTHALVIGTSSYAHLPGPDEPLGTADGPTFGLGQAQTPATSAWAFANWLDASYNNPLTPLGTIRLLLSPSAAEQQQIPQLGALEPTVELPTRKNVSAALRAWRDDCRTNAGHVAILFVGGHGVQITKEDSLVLLQDFASPDQENLLSGALDVGSIRRAMCGATIAQDQYYFVDACRLRPGIFDDYATLEGALRLDVPNDPPPSVSPVFYGASSGTAALGEPGKGTLFCQALLDCLDLYAVEDPEMDGKWTVTPSSLYRALPKRVRERAEGLDASQKATSGGDIGEERPFHELPQPPNVPVTIGVDPAEAGPVSWAKLWFGTVPDPVVDHAALTQPLTKPLPAGLYSLEVTIDPATNPYRGTTHAIPLPVLPPKSAFTHRAVAP